MIAPSASPDASASESEDAAPQTTNANVSTAATPNTTGSVRGFVSDSREGLSVVVTEPCLSLGTPYNLPFHPVSWLVSRCSCTGQQSAWAGGYPVSLQPCHAKKTR
ncbi:hypothetical protein GCM10022245_23080 [Streptomyces mayteni]